MSEIKLIYRGGYNAKNLGTDNSDKVPKLKEIDIAHGLLTRDYKGLSDWNANVCMEVYKIGTREELMELINGKGI